MPIAISSIHLGPTIQSVHGGKDYIPHILDAFEHSYIFCLAPLERMGGSYYVLENVEEITYGK